MFFHEISDFMDGAIIALVTEVKKENMKSWGDTKLPPGKITDCNN
jgi:hypothetical protein